MIVGSYLTWSFGTLLGALADNSKLGCRIGLIADEVQAMVVETHNMDDPHVQLLRQLESFARYEAGALLVLSGSSANLRSRLFEFGREPRFRLYPNFNKLLCSYWHVSALRSTAALGGYLQQRYPERHFTEEDTAQLLHRTGGIGRLVHNTVTYRLRARALTRAEDPERAFKNKASGFFVLVNLIRRHVRTLPVDATLERAIVAASSGAPPEMLTPAAVAMPHDLAIAELRWYGIAQPELAIEAWVDQDLLYLGADDGFPTVELARPIDALTYFVNQPDADDLLRLQRRSSCFPAAASG